MPFVPYALRFGMAVGPNEEAILRRIGFVQEHLHAEKENDDSEAHPEMDVWFGHGTFFAVVDGVLANVPVPDHYGF